MIAYLRLVRVGLVAVLPSLLTIASGLSAIYLLGCWLSHMAYGQPYIWENMTVPMVLFAVGVVRLLHQVGYLEQDR